MESRIMRSSDIYELAAEMVDRETSIFSCAAIHRAYRYEFGRSYTPASEELVRQYRLTFHPEQAVIKGGEQDTFTVKVWDSAHTPDERRELRVMMLLLMSRIVGRKPL